MDPFGSPNNESKDTTAQCARWQQVCNVWLSQTKQGCSIITVLHLGQHSGPPRLCSQAPGTLWMSQRSKEHRLVCAPTDWKPLAVPDEARLFYNSCASSGTALRSASLCSHATDFLLVTTCNRTGTIWLSQTKQGCSIITVLRLGQPWPWAMDWNHWLSQVFYLTVWPVWDKHRVRAHAHVCAVHACSG